MTADLAVRGRGARVRVEMNFFPYLLATVATESKKYENSRFTGMQSAHNG